MVSATRAAKDPGWAFRPTGSNVFVFVRDVTHVQTCEKKCFVLEFLGPTSNMSKPVMMFVFKELRNRLLRYILQWRSCSKRYPIDCFGTYFKHVQTCDAVRVHRATQSTASVHTSNMSKPVMTFVFTELLNRLLRYILQTCPNLWWRSCSKSYAIDCFGTYFKRVQSCDDARVQRATQSTASVHTWNTSKPVMTFLFKVLRNRLLRYIYFKHFQACDDVCVHKAL